jgi:hypothetical protein
MDINTDMKQLIVTDVSYIKQENNKIRIYISGYLDSNNKYYEFDLPYDMVLYEALNNNRLMTGIIDKHMFYANTIKGYNEKHVSENQICPFCKSQLLQKHYKAIEDNDWYCYNASCQNNSILKLMDMFDHINIDFNLEDIIFILGMFNQYLSPKIDLVSIIGNLRERQIFNDKAKSLLNKLDYFVYSMSATDLLKVLNIHDNDFKIDTLDEMSPKVLVDKFLSCNCPIDLNLKFIQQIIQLNLSYINKLLNYQILLRSDSMSV